jgi:GH15 family glucan-1,4-alpha-glucosidase
VAMRWAVRPGTRFGTAKPTAERRGDAVLVHCGDQHLVLRCFEVGDASIEKHDVTGMFTTSPATSGIFAISVSDNAPLYLPDRRGLESRLDDTLRAWHDWCAELTYDGRWSAAVHRSGLVLKLLRYSPTGAIAAAATTSLPERIGGDKNWDYRFTWVRDTSFTVDACIQLGLADEVQAAVTSLLKAVRSTLPGLDVFYRIDGRPGQPERQVDVPGYRNSRPVRVGNRAAVQLQLGTFGDFFDCIWHYVQAGHLLDAPAAEMLARLADQCCKSWRSKDAGIWELLEPQHYTASKMGCWLALDRAVRLHEGGHIRGKHVRRWKRERDDIKDWVNARCWSEDKQSYTFFAGNEGLDAAVLLGGMSGFEVGPRMASTIDAIRRELGVGPLIYRYTGMQCEEGAFLACSFWMVAVLAALDRVDEAIALMDDAVGLSNDLGLMSEQMDPASGEMLGNLPQAFSHLALVNAACAVEQAIHRRASEQPASA